MEYELWPLIGSIVLLCVPSYLFFTSRIRRRVTESQPSSGFPLRGVVLTWQNWLDLARGYGGAYLIFNLTFPLERRAETYFQELGIVAGILALGLMLNTYYRRRHLYCLAPAFMVVGISMVLYDWWIVLYGALAGLVIGRVTNSAEAFLITTGVIIGAFGYFVGGISLMLLLTCALTVLPIVYAFTTKRGLAIASIHGSLEE